MAQRRGPNFFTCFATFQYLAFSVAVDNVFVVLAGSSVVR